MLEPFWRSLILLSNFVMRGGYVSWNPSSVVSLGCYSPFVARESSPVSTGGYSVGFENCIACNTPFAILRGVQCLCLSSDEYENLIRVENRYCDIRCDTPDFMCGGNLGGNLYCNKYINESLCYSKLEEDVMTEKIYRNFEDHSSDTFPSIEPCLELGCRTPPSIYTFSYAEYFPNLNPEDCIIYCTYVSTSYAYVGWQPIGKGIDFSPTCICSNSTSPSDEDAPACQSGNCPEPLNPIDSVEREDDYEPSCGNKNGIVPQYSVYCTTKALQNANGTRYCEDLISSLTHKSYCNPEALTTQAPRSSSFTSQPSTSVPDECPKKLRTKAARDDPGLELQCSPGNCEPPSCSFNGACYYFYELVNTPDDVDLLRNISAGECHKKGGHLLAIETVEEETFIFVTFFSVMSHTYETFLTSGILDSPNAQPYWYYCDVKMPMETNDTWMMPFQEGDGYPSYLVIDASSGNGTLKFTRCEVGRFYMCEFPEPKTNLQTTITKTTLSTTTTFSSTVEETESNGSETSAFTGSTNSAGTTDVPVVNTDDCPCTEVDYYGVLWIVPANKTKIKDCRPGAVGSASWACDHFVGVGCQLRTDQPDYSNCHSLELDFIAENVANNGTALEVIWEELYNFTGPNDKYFGHEIIAILDLVTKTLDRQEWELSGTNSHLEFQLSSTEIALQIINNLLSHDVQWYQINQYNRSMSALELLSVSEDIAFRVTEVAEKEGHSLLCESIAENITISSLYWDGFQTSVEGCELNTSFYLNPDLLLRFPTSSIDTFIRLPDNVLESGQAHKAAGVLITHFLIEFLLPGGNNAMELTQKRVNSPLISYTVGNKRESYGLPNGTHLDLVLKHATTAKDPPVKALRRYLNPGEAPSAVIGSGTCAFLVIDSSAGKRKSSDWTWENAGCEIYSSNRTHTVCQCSHLTGFSNLMDFHDYIGDVLALDITSIVCSTSSVISLAVTFIIFTILKVIKTDRTVITQNLCISLMFSHLIILTTFDRHYLKLDDITCATMGILLHFTLLVSFMWMAVEGVRLCRMVLYVFNLRDWTRYYLLAAYLTPTFIVTATVLTAYFTTGILQAYAGDEMCWLNGENYKWSFAGPITVVIVTNVIFTLIAIYSSWNLKQNEERSFNQKFRNAVAMSLSLTCLLGISWLTGFLLYAEAIVFAYIFTVTNGLQGFMMFIFRCVLNEEVRNALKDRWKRRRNRKLGRWSSTTTTKGTSLQRFHSPVAGRTFPRLYQTHSTLSIQSNLTKVTDVSVLPNPSEGPIRRHQTVRTVSGTEYFEESNSSEQLSISGDSDFSFYRTENIVSQHESPRRVGFADTDTSSVKKIKSSGGFYGEENSSTKYHKMILVNRKTDMMPFTDLDPMMFF